MKKNPNLCNLAMFSLFQCGAPSVRRHVRSALYFVLVVVSLGTLLASCGQNVKNDVVELSEVRDSDTFLVVDCLLPGQVRKLGGNLTYLTQRRPIKTSANNCEIRGGEYVAFDRADYSTALKIWLPMAKQGEAEAQTYVGEIYEKGLGLLSDFHVAAHWYQLAADQGLSRAQINLGHLYEKGLGVEKDHQRALNLYRQASGINSDSLVFASTLNASYVPRKRFEGVQSELRKQQQASELLEQKIHDVSDTLDSRSAALSSAEKQLMVTQSELSQLTKRFAVSVVDKPEAEPSLSQENIGQLRSEHQELERQLRQSNTRNQQLAEKHKALTAQLLENDKLRLEREQRVSNLNQELAGSKQRLKQSEQEFSELEQRLQEEGASGKDGTPVILALQDNLMVKTRELIDERKNVAALESNNHAHIKGLQLALQDLNDKHVRMSGESSYYKEQLAVFTTALAERELQLESTKAKLNLAQNAFGELNEGQQQRSFKELNLVARVKQLERERKQLTDKLSAMTLKNQVLDQDQESLASRLSKAKTMKVDYQQQLENLKQQALKSKQHLQASEQELKSVEQRLQQVQKSSAELTPAIIALQDDLVTKTRELIDERERYNSLDNDSAQKQQQLRDALAALEDKQRELRKENSGYKEQLESLNTLLSDNQQQRSETDQQLLLSRAELSLERNQQEEALARLSDDHAEEQQLLKQQQQLQRTELASLTKKFQQQLAVVASQKRHINDLQDEAVRFQNELTGLAPTAAISSPTGTPYTPTVLLASNDFPGVEIIEPPVILTRSRPSVRLHTFRGERQVVGKVLAPAGLMSLSINGKPHDLGANSLFRTTIMLQDDPTPVDVVVVDNKGRRAAVSFSFINYAQGGTPEQKIAATLTQYGASDEDTRVSMGQYYALIIGNNNYQHYSTLSTAVNDATVTEELLRDRYNFTTRLLLNADRYAILSALNDLRQNLRTEDNLLIYYAGHGRLDESNGRGYWLPIDAEVDNTSNWISNTAITDILNVTEAKHILVVADSCYAGTLTQTPLARMETEIPSDVRAEWIKVMAETRARITLTSGGIEPVLDGGGGSHSVFAKAFLDTLRTNDSLLEGYSLYSQVLSKIAASSGAIDQIPQYAPIHLAGHESGEFFFNPI